MISQAFLSPSSPTHIIGTGGEKGIHEGNYVAYYTGIKFQYVDAMHSSYYGLDQSGTECSKTLSIHNLRVVSHS